jgi:hypothetical protein
MKKTVLIAVWCSALLLAVTSCGSKKDKDNKLADTPAATTGTTTESSSGKKGMTVSEAKDFLDADEANKGKEVTVTAYSWGSNERMDDKIQLNLGDQKLEGMQSASFACMFGKDQSAAIKAIAKDALVTVTGKISKGAGGVELNDCKLVQ